MRLRASFALIPASVVPSVASFNAEALVLFKRMGDEFRQSGRI